MKTIHLKQYCDHTNVFNVDQRTQRGFEDGLVKVLEELNEKIDAALQKNRNIHVTKLNVGYFNIPDRVLNPMGVLGFFRFFMQGYESDFTPPADTPTTIDVINTKRLPEASHPDPSDCA